MLSGKKIALLTGLAALDTQCNRILQQDGWDTAVCSYSDELYLQVTQTRVDAIVISQQLPGFLSGLDMIERLCRELFRPVFILIGDLSPAELDQAQLLKIAAILPSNSDAETIASTARTSFLAAVHTGIIISARPRLLVREARDIAPLPQLLVKLTQFLNDPDASIRILATEIATDARVTANLLKLINSAAMGFTVKLKRLDDVIRMLGIERTISLILTSYLAAGPQKRGLSISRELDSQLRLRSVFLAATAKTYATLNGHRNPEMAYFLGLLQDIGISVLANQLGEPYLRMLTRCQSVAQLQLSAYEIKELGYSHAEVSAAMLQKWELPTSIIRPILEHHLDFTTRSNPEDRELIAAMQVAESLADLKDNPSPQRFVALRRLANKLDRCSESTLRTCMQQSVALTCELGRLFSIPVPETDELFQMIVTLSNTVGLDLGSEAESQDCGISTADESAGIVVILDDDPMILEIVESILRHGGFDVRTASDETQLELAFMLADVILLDVHLHYRNGNDVLRRLRQAGISTPVIMMTGDRTRATIEESIVAGTTDFILKPFSEDQLLTKIRQNCRHYFQQDDMPSPRNCMGM